MSRHTSRREMKATFKRLTGHVIGYEYIHDGKRYKRKELAKKVKSLSRLKRKNVQITEVPQIIPLERDSE